MTQQLAVLDLFSGIGGFSLGFERTGGFRTVAFCEQNDYARRVLAKHWPGVPCFDDVHLLGRDTLDAAGVGAVDLICGGFPCQDISLAGRGAGLAGQRSGLWFEFVRIIGEVRPAWVVAENVAALRSRGLDTVLGSLAALGYDAEWHCIPAAAVGAPHRRDRVWIVAHPGRFDVLGWGSDVADTSDERLPLAKSPPLLSARRWDEGRAATERRWWAVEPAVGRMAHGVPARVDRLKCLGNAVVPQIPELIGRAILQCLADAASLAHGHMG